MKRYRNEWKYRVQETDLAVIENKVAAVGDFVCTIGNIGKTRLLL